MEDLTEGIDEEEPDLSDIEKKATDSNSDNNEDMQTQEAGNSQNLVSGSFQGESSRR